MPINIALNQLVHAVQSGTLAKVAEQIPPGAYHFRVAKLLDAVDAEIAGYNKQHQALFKKYGIPGKNDKGQDILTLIGVAPEASVAFNDAMNELLAAETTIPYEPIIWSKLGEKAQQALSIQDVRALGPLLVEDEAALTAPTPTPVA
jgi:hypothetical protein